jgi:hypothetical protein
MIQGRKPAPSTSEIKSRKPIPSTTLIRSRRCFRLPTSPTGLGCTSQMVLRASCSWLKTVQALQTSVTSPMTAEIVLAPG